MEKQARASWSRSPPIRSGAQLAHYASLIIGFAVLLYITRKLWFWFDEWEFLTRGIAGRPLALFVPHHEHWSTIPVLVYRGLFNLFGVRTYQPYMAVLLLAHASVAHWLWRLMLRSGADPWVATSSSALFLVLGAAYENILWAFQIGFVGSFAFGLAAVLVVDRNHTGSRRGTVLTWALLVASLMCSGVGLTMVVVAALTALFGSGVRAAVTTLSVPTAVFLAWFVTFGHQGVGSDVATLPTLLLLPRFIWLGITSALDGLAGFGGIGTVATIAVVAWLIWHRHEAKTHPVAFAAAIGAVVYYFIVGTGRAALNLGEAAAPRHVYAAALLLPVIAWMLSDLVRRDVLAQIAVCTLVAFSAALGFSQLAATAHAGLANGVERFPPGQSERQILAAAALLEAGLRPIARLPDPAGAPDLTIGALEIMVRDGDLPNGVALSPADTLSARAALQTSLTTSPMFGLGTASIVSATGALTTRGPDGCLHLRSVSTPLAIRLIFTSPGSVSLQSSTLLTLQFYLQVSNDDSITANALPLQLNAGPPSYLNVLIDNATPYIVAPSGSLTICGASMTP
jgi:hypothetical protein